MLYLTTKEIEQNERNLAIPTDLSEDGIAAARCILTFLEARRMTYTANCKLFHSPKKWKAKTEELGAGSLLIINHDNGMQTEVFCRGNWHMFMALNAELQKIGLHCVPCTCWYSAIWPISRSPQSKAESASADVNDPSIANP